uniref:Uncharacterized protein n=1 Tax=Cacopsylla melanoneura TaxID=428564 RepID=A0A8D8QPM1_9HEMI
MMKVTLVGLVIATVVALLLGQGAAYIPDAANLEKFNALHLPNPVCKLNTDCDPVKGVVIGIVDAKYKGNSIISQDCSCIEQSSLEQKEVCSCKVTFKPVNGVACQTYYEEVFLANVTQRVEAQYKIV